MIFLIKAKDLAKPELVINVKPTKPIALGQEFLQIGDWFDRCHNEFDELLVDILAGPTGTQLGQSLCDRGQLGNWRIPALFSIGLGRLYDEKKVRTMKKFKEKNNLVSGFTYQGNVMIILKKLEIATKNGLIFRLWGITRSRRSWEKKTSFYRVVVVYNVGTGQGQMIFRLDPSIESDEEPYQSKDREKKG